MMRGVGPNNDVISSNKTVQVGEIVLLSRSALSWRVLPPHGELDVSDGHACRLQVGILTSPRQTSDSRATSEVESRPYYDRRCH